MGGFPDELVEFSDSLSDSCAKSIVAAVTLLLSGEGALDAGKRPFGPV
jgi:hypothetical protein